MTKELVVFVDKKGRPTGETSEKLAAHTGQTKLHLAFSCYVFNAKGELLVTQRAHQKKVWPGVWTNSVCGHPAPGEAQEMAIRRRLAYELGMKTGDVSVVLPDYMYKTPPFKGIVEHEFCPVFVTRTNEEPNPNPNEVADYQWMKWEDYGDILRKDDMGTWSWWCKDQHIQLERLPEFMEFAKSSSLAKQ